MELIGSSEPFRKLIDRVERVAGSEAPVLLAGEMGTGKGVIARRIHQASPRRRGNFVVVDCRTLPGGLIESELFGHRRGAFSGAFEARAGRLQVADGGSLYLDGVDELALAQQVHFLRAIESKEFLPIGAELPLRANFRVIAAASPGLAEKVRTGRFRQDLYYRLHVVELLLPPLRERRADIPDLARSFLIALARSYAKPTCRFSPGALEVLQGYSWPGNLHELRGIVEAALAAAIGETIEATDLPLKIRVPDGAPAGAPERNRGATATPTYHERVIAFQRELLLEALGRHRWDLRRTAHSLGLHRHQLKYVCSKLSIRRPRAPLDSP